MRKIYFITYTAIVALVFVCNCAFAQAPAFTYPDTLRLTTGQTMTPAKPTHTGGAVPGLLYSNSSTIAGSGGYGHKDTIAALASFTNPVNIAVDHNGIIYVADANSNCIRKISGGKVSTFAGSVNGIAGGKNGQDTAARFYYPTGVAVDGSGNVYVADYSNSLIRKITPSGFVSTLAGNQNPGATDGTGTAASFNHPYSLTIIPTTSKLWVADTYNHKVRLVSTLDGSVTTVTGTGAAGFTNGNSTPVYSSTNASYNTPKGIVVDKNLNIYLAEEGNNCVRKVSLKTFTTTTFAIGKFDRPIGIALDSLNNVYVSSEGKYNIYKFSSDGKLVDSLNYPAFSGGNLSGYADGTDTLAKYRGGMGLYYDGSNNLLVTDPSSDYIRQVAINGYSVYPRLPDGLTLGADGSISGTPTKVMAPKTYTISAHNSKGVSSYNVTITSTAGPQVITFNPPAAVKYGDSDFTPVVSSNSTAAIIYTSDNPSVATIVNNKIHIVGAGTTNITASQPANANYAAAVPVTQPLLINKAFLSASVYHYYNQQGKDLPAFTIYYYGYLNGDTTSVIKTLPTAVTTATADSPVGDYPITVSGGVADNYNFTYHADTLTIVPTPVITSAGSTSLPKGDSVLLTVTPSTSEYKLQWYLNGTAIKGATSANYYASQVGAYTVSIAVGGYTFYSLYTPVNVQLVLPADNFSVKMTGVSCKGDDDGAIFISAAQSLKYEATVNGNGINQEYPFTDTLRLSKLSPGNYSVCISVDNELFNQCYQLTITEPQDLSVYSTINKTDNTISLQLAGGSSFNINLNDVVYTTTNNNITLPLAAGVNKMVVTTDKLCQGVIEKSIDMSGITAPYPNPFTGILNVNIGSIVINNLKVDMVNVINGKSVFSDQLTNKSGVLQFDLSGIAGGIYYFNLNLDNKTVGYKIIKK